MILDPDWVEEIRSRLPELPDAKCERFMKYYGLSLYDANLLTGSKALADYFETCLKVGGKTPVKKRAKMVSNWLLGEFSRLLNATGEEIEDSKVTPQHLAEMLDLVDEGTLGGTAAKVVFEEMFYSGKYAEEIVKQKGLAQISDTSAIDEAVAHVIAENTNAVSDFKKGKEQALKYLVGQVMRATHGRAKPGLVDELLKRALTKEGE